VSTIISPGKLYSGFCIGSHTYENVTQSWYKRSEFGIRAAIFFSAATVSGAFGGLLAVRHLLLDTPLFYIPS
jgi:hypothetical protein